MQQPSRSGCSRRAGRGPAWRELAVVAGAFVVGVALRGWVIGGSLGYVDVDEATVGLQGDTRRLPDHLP